jgi:aspartyl aminopeptidase
LIASAGQDDGVCAFTAIRAILDIDSSIFQNILQLVHYLTRKKQESNGNTGAHHHGYNLYIMYYDETTK